jgi:hypothetical protein
VCVCVYFIGWITETSVIKGIIEIQELNLYILLLEGSCAVSVPGRS